LLKESKYVHKVPPMPPDPKVKPEPHRTRYGRTVRPPVRYLGYATVTDAIEAHAARITYAPKNPHLDYCYLSFLHFDFEFGTQEGLHPMTPFGFKMTKGSNPDMPTFNQAMASTQSEHWKIACEAEIAELERRATWTQVERSDLPDGTNVIPGTWALKVKRLPDGSFRKFKARFCVRGDKQIEGLDFFETYAPVVSWTTVRMMLILSTSLNMSTVQVDYSNAFAQAHLKEDIYISVPQGFGSEGGTAVLKLNRSLYGLKQAAICWFDKLRDGLLDQGWKQIFPHLEPCLFYKDGVICLVYVDDCLFFGASNDLIHKYIDEIKAAGFDLTIESDVYAFLGVQVERDAHAGTVTLSQPGLIKKIVAMSKVENSKATPADKVPLGPGIDDDPHDEDWQYAAMVGCLGYLGNNSRPDIQFAVHQCARYTHSPRKCHSLAAKRICRYLAGTMDKGITFKPSDEISLDMYVDADFAGMWNSDLDRQDPVCVKSRSGHVLLLAGCPMLWSSKLQTEIAVSTMEAEYIALSNAMRDLIPARQLLEGIAGALKLKIPGGAKLRSTVFEDNNGALILATVPRMTPRSKHIAVKYHWFKSHVGPHTGIEIVKVATDLQLADILTKGLVADKFTPARQQLMGWYLVLRSRGSVTGTPVMDRLD
jgi:hypothetical protein